MKLLIIGFLLVCIFLLRKERFQNKPSPVASLDNLVETSLRQKIYKFIKGERGEKGVPGNDAPDPIDLNTYLESIKNDGVIQ